MAGISGAIAQLIGGLLAAYMQGDLNRKAVEETNLYNEEMYNEHMHPVARAKELKLAGLSDSAIGQALSGAGSGTSLNLNSQPNQAPDIMNSILGALNAGNIANDTENKKLTGDQIKQNIKRAKLDYNHAVDEYNVYYHTMDKLIQMKDYELQQLFYNLQQTKSAAVIAKNQEDMAKYESIIAQFKTDWFNTVGIEYDKAVLSDNILEMIDNLIHLLGGQYIDGDYKSKNIDELDPLEMNIYNDHYKHE